MAVGTINYGGGAGEGAAPLPQCKSSIDSAGLLRFLVC